MVGRIVNYRIVLDPVARQNRQRQLDRPDLSPSYRETLERQTTFLSDYARFDVIVDEVLRGTPPRRFSVTWDNSTFGEPATIKPSQYLIALRAVSTNTRPLAGPAAASLVGPAGTILQCCNRPAHRLSSFRLLTTG